MTTQEKIDKLDEIAVEIKSFKGLEIARNCTQAVPGEGDPDAKIMFIGEAPGFNEDREGRPFVGQAGKLLEKTLLSIGLQRSDVFITNIVKFRPPDNRDPLPDEIEACRDWLDQQIETINPNIIATLGRYSMAKFIPDVSISRVHGQSRFVDFNGSKYIVFPMYHPAAALRAGSVMQQFVQDFNKLKSILVNTAEVPVIAVTTPPVKAAQTSLF
jgi:DNA polymerase